MKHQIDHHNDLRESPPKRAKHDAAIADKIARAKAAIAARVAALKPDPHKGRLAEIQARIEAATAQRLHKALEKHRHLQLAHQHDQQYEESPHARGGLAMGIHPALASASGSGATPTQPPPLISSRAKKQAIKPKFATTKANLKKGPPLPKPPPQRKRLELLHGPSEDYSDPSKNPFFDPSLGQESASQRNRTSKPLLFNEHGKYILQADAIRQTAKMDELKKRIAESTKKAGLEEQLDVSDKAYKRDLPPDIEWWDSHLTTNHTYDDLDYGLAKIYSSSSPISIYIQHPIPIPPVHSGKPIPPRALMLTHREQKKLRRQTRAEHFKNISDQRRLGLLPPEKPKVKPSNFMRVLAGDAIKDPTLVEAQMKRDVEERAAKHVNDNQARKLSPQARRDKIAKQLEVDAAKGIRAAAFKVKYLAHGQHKFKIDKTATQLGLSGVVILSPKLNLVVVEGGAKSIKAYKKLMLSRIDWTNSAKTPSTRNDHPEQDQQQDLSENTCHLIWEGDLKDRQFKNWKFKSVVSDSAAREALDRGNAGHLWLAATKFKSDDYD